MVSGSPESRPQFDLLKWKDDFVVGVMYIFVRIYMYMNVCMSSALSKLSSSSFYFLSSSLFVVYMLVQMSHWRASNCRRRIRRPVPLPMWRERDYF